MHALQHRPGFLCELIGALTLVCGAVGCSANGSADASNEQLGRAESTLTADDGLAQAYSIFKGMFVTQNEHKHYRIGFGHHPGLSTIKVLGPHRVPVNGQITLHSATDFSGTAGTVTGTMTGPIGGQFDLYFVKNTLADGTVKPELGDQIFKAGTFAFSPTALEPNRYRLQSNIGSAPFPAFGVNFDLDMVVVTQAFKSPLTSVVATGSRTLFEKRFFREQAGLSLDPVVGTLSRSIETNDPLVQRGAELFFSETFGGNGRTCGTCHKLEDNLTLSPETIAKLPASDPLFVVPDGLEDPSLLPHALIRENLDGFEDVSKKFVVRSIPHTLSLSTSIGEVITSGAGINDALGMRVNGPPPEQRTGWSGDGAPGRGTMNEFAFGAVVQHFTRSTDRVPNSDFRIPTQAELDALEAFQLFTGRQKNPVAPAITYGDAAANAGRDFAQGAGNCVTCHRDLIGNPSINFNIDTGVENLGIAFRTAENMPKDAGFGNANFNPDTRVLSPGSVETGFGDGQFNVPPLYEAADTAPFFHNNAANTIEEAVNFYSTPEFLASRGARIFASPNQTQFPAQKNNVVAFLRTINAITNVTQVRKRVTYLRDNATPGGTAILYAAVADTQDAIEVLSSPTLSGKATRDALKALRTIKLMLQNSAPYANNQPTTVMIQTLAWLKIAQDYLIVQNPLNDFL